MLRHGEDSRRIGDVREHADAAADAAAAAAAATPHGCVDYHSWADPLRLALQRRALRRYQGTYVLLSGTYLP